MLLFVILLTIQNLTQINFKIIGVNFKTNIISDKTAMKVKIFVHLSCYKVWCYAPTMALKCELSDQDTKESST